MEIRRVTRREQGENELRVSRIVQTQLLRDNPVRRPGHVSGANETEPGEDRAEDCGRERREFSCFELRELQRKREKRISTARGMLSRGVSPREIDARWWKLKNARAFTRAPGC